jgi:hypothetical protein
METIGNNKEVLIKEMQNQEVPLRGRAAFISRYKALYPDIDTEPDDETLFDFADKSFSEKEDLKSKYDKLNGSNEKLAAIISEDPRFAQFIAMVANGENMMYALGKVFGNLIDELDDEGLQQLRAGQEEYKQRYQKIKENFDSFENNLKAYGEKNNLTAEDVANIRDAVLDLALAFNDGAITEEIIDIIYKGLDYDNEQTAKIEAARLSGRNEAIEEMKNKKKQTAIMPDLGVEKSNASNKSIPKIDKKEQYKNYFDQLERIK